MKIHKVLCHNIFVDYKRVVREIETSACIGVSFPVDASAHIPPYPDAFKAIWDTGATGTCISEDIATKFQLRLSGQVEIQGVTGVSVCNTYLLALHLPNGVIIPELEVSGCVENIGCDILIGMDVINMGDFAVCNTDNTTTFSFRIPSIARINFTEPDAPVFGTKIGRNSLCPCGSGKKFKKCHGA